jgi:hypothetical protein
MRVDGELRRRLPAVFSYLEEVTTSLVKDI